MQPHVTTSTYTEGSSTGTSYQREDLGILTATIERERGVWIIKLYYGPEPHEHDRYERALESDADKLAVQHALSW